MSRSLFSAELVDGVIVVLDQDGALSVTNDAENVVRRLAKDYNLVANPIVYRDTMGAFDAIKVRDNQFEAFVIIGALDYTEAVRKAKELRRRGDL